MGAETAVTLIHPRVNSFPTIGLAPTRVPLQITGKMDALRSALQPVTHNLPGPIREIGLSLIGDSCYKKLILDIDLEHNPECLKLAISKALGIGIVAASSIVKVPQILKLVNSKSASGVSFLSYLLETSSLLTSLAYNVRNGFPFSTFGETALILGQNVIISVLVLKYSGRAGIAALFVAALAVGVATLFSEQLLNMQRLSYLQAGAGVLGVASKVPQILAILQEGGTGQLSAFAVRTSSPSIPITSLLVLLFKLLAADAVLLVPPRSSTTSPDPSRASLPLFKRSTTSSYCTGLLPVLR